MFSSRSYLIVVLAFLVLLDGFALWLVAKVDYERTYEHARIVLEKTAISLEERIKRTVIATDAILQGRALRIKERGIDKTTASKEEWERFRNAAKALPDAGSLWLLDASGNLLMDSTAYPSPRINFSERGYYNPHRDQGIETYIGPVVKGRITKKYSFTISRRISGKNGAFLGVVLAALETDDFTNFLRQIDIGENGTVTVFRTDGSLILRQPMQDEYLGKTFKHLKLFSIDLNASPSGTYTTNAMDGIQRLVAYNNVEGMPLVVATAVPMDSIMQGWRGRVKGYSFIATFILLALMGFSWLVRKTTIKEEKERIRELSEINQALQTEATERLQAQIALQESKQRWVTTLASIGDAVIATDVSGRVTFMNAVAEELTGWTFSDAGMKPVADVFKIINEYTRQEVESPIAKVLRVGMIVGLANHTILVSKDGTEVAIDDSGAPIRDESGTTTGVVLVFRDITERKRAEEQIRHIASFPELNPNPVLEIDTSGQLTYCNQATHKILKEEGLDKVNGNVFIPPDVGLLLKDLNSAGTSVLYREIWVKERVFGETIVLVPELRVMRIYAYDITERHEAERARRENQQDLNRAQAVGRIGSWRLNVQRNELRWSDENHRIFGIPKGTPMTYEAFLSIVHPHDRDYVDRMWSAALHGEHYDIEHRIIVGDTVKWVREMAGLEFDKDGVLLGGFGTTQDITERKEAEKRIQDSNKRLNILSTVGSQLLATNEPQTVVESLCKNVMECLDCDVFFNFIVDDEKQKLHLNAFEGIPRQTAAEIEWLDYGADACGVVVHDAGCIIAEHVPTTTDLTTDLIRAFGIEAYACCTLLSRSKVIGTISFGSRSRLAFSDDDLSMMQTVADQLSIAIERKMVLGDLRRARDDLGVRVQERTSELQKAYETLQAETAQRQQMEDELRQTQKMQAIGTLAGGIAHDFNNIIAGIIGFTEMVLEDVPPESTIKRRLQLVLKAAYRGRDLVRQILTFSRQRAVEKKPVSMSLVINEVLSLIRASLPSTIDIRQNISAETDIVAADPTQIHQILLNLCSNAAHAMRDGGGVLELSLSDAISDSEEYDTNSRAKEGHWLKLTIRDTGCGMEPQVVERVFDPFFTTKAPGEGTGLGLSVVHGIVKSHDGAITIRSKPGEGSSFHIFLPKLVLEGTTETESTTETPKGGESILIVDDEDMLVEMTCQRLQRLGYRVIGTTSSTEALEVFRAEPDGFDLLITDYTMPNMTGLDLAREVLRMRPELPVIMCSGLSEPLPVERLREMGIEEFVVKPVGSEDFARLVHNVLEKSKAKSFGEVS